MSFLAPFVFSYARTGKDGLCQGERMTRPYIRKQPTFNPALVGLAYHPRGSAGAGFSKSLI